MWKHLLQIVLVIVPFRMQTQINIDSLRHDIETHDKKVFNSRIYTLTSKKYNTDLSDSKVYESQGLFHSAYILLNSDSTYVYYTVFEVGFKLSFGKWSVYSNDTLTLNWDKQMTLTNIKDEKIYRKYFEYSFPTAVPMTNWRIRRTKKGLEPIN